MDVNEKMVAIFDTKKEAGIASGKAIEKAIIDLLKEKEEIRIIFAAAPSQNDTLDYLVGSKSIPWNRIIAFNMDEYIGLQPSSEQLFASYLKGRIFSKVNVKKLHLIDPSQDVQKEIERITQLITASTIDLVILGVGQNGHIAFNDPPYADFNDPAVIKAVELDLICREQQVTDKCFAKLEEVPLRALTLTVPTIMNARELFCVVSGKHKAQAVYETINGELSKDWPSTVLRTHPNCRFYFDKEAAEMIR